MLLFYIHGNQTMLVMNNYSINFLMLTLAKICRLTEMSICIYK